MWTVGWGRRPPRKKDWLMNSDSNSPEGPSKRPILNFTWDLGSEIRPQGPLMDTKTIITWPEEAGLRGDNGQQLSGMMATTGSYLNWDSQAAWSRGGFLGARGEVLGVWGSRNWVLVMLNNLTCYFHSSSVYLCNILQIQTFDY